MVISMLDEATMKISTGLFLMGILCLAVLPSCESFARWNAEMNARAAQRRAEFEAMRAKYRYVHIEAPDAHTRSKAASCLARNGFIPTNGGYANAILVVDVDCPSIQRVNKHNSYTSSTIKYTHEAFKTRARVELRAVDTGKRLASGSGYSRASESWTDAGCRHSAVSQALEYLF